MRRRKAAYSSFSTTDRRRFSVNGLLTADACSGRWLGEVMGAVARVLTGLLDRAHGSQDLPGPVDVGLGVGGAYAGDGHSGGGSQVGQPIRAGAGQLASVSQQYPDIAVGLIPAMAGVLKCCQKRIAGLRGRVRVT